MLGTFLRFKGLTFQSLWLDELASAQITLSNSIPRIFEICKIQDVHPPLYYIVLRIWESIFGGNEYSLRSLSAVLGVLGMIAIYFLGKELFSSTIGLYALAIASVNPFHIYLSQEVRSYAAIFLLSILSYLYLVKLTKQPCYKNIILYVLITSSLLYTHYFGLFILCSQIVFFFIEFFEQNKSVKFFKVVSLSLFSIFILYTPWLIRLFKMTKIGSFWIEKPLSNFFVHYFKLFLGYEPFIVIVFSGLLIIYLIARNEKYEFVSHKILLLSWIFVTLLVPYIRSLLDTPLLTDRNAIVILPALLLVGSKAIESIKARSVQKFILLSLIIMFLVNLFCTNVYTGSNFYKIIFKEQWRIIAKFVLRNDPHQEFFERYLSLHLF